MVFSSYESQTHNIEAQTELHWQATQHVGFDLGVDVDTRHDGGGGTNVTAGPVRPYMVSSLDESQVTVVSVFAQYKHEIPLLKGLLLTAGGRLDIGSSPGASYVQASPRVALVQRLPKYFGLRASYGTALRGPGVKELNLSRQCRSGP